MFSFHASGSDFLDFLENLFGQLPDFNLNQFTSGIAGALGIGVLFIMVLSIVSMFFAVMAYVFNGFTRMLAGRKAGYNSDWMAFVPFAWDIYRLKFTLSPLGDLFFFGSVGVAFIVVIDLLLIALSAGISVVFGVIAAVVTLVWLVMHYIVTYKFNVRYYGGFGFDTKLALITFIPGGVIIMSIIDIIIAFKKDVVWSGARVERAVYSAPAAYTPPVAPVAPVASIAPDASGTICCIAGVHMGEEIRLKANEKVTFGRDASNCQIVFPESEADISGVHCTVYYSSMDNKFIVTDYSSSGTFTGDDRRLVQGEPISLFPGTVIFLGNRSNSFRLG